MKTSIFCALFFWNFVLFGQPAQLKIASIRPSYEEMLGYHIEYKVFSPLLAQRSLKLFLEQFDRDKSYLLREEVLSFIEVSEEETGRVVEEYNAGSFKTFQRFNQLISKAILRARVWRAEIRRELILRDLENLPSTAESYLHYAGSEDKLKERIQKQIVRFLLSEKEGARFADWTPSRREKILNLLEKRLQRIENSYLASNEKESQDSDSEHFFSLHVLKALAKSLDAHTTFFSPEEAFEMRTALEKEFEGVGVLLRETVDGVMIAGLIKGGPAERSGKIVVGDILFEIDGKKMEEASYEDVLKEMKGNARGEINLTLKRYNDDASSNLYGVQLKREKVLMEDERVQYSYMPYGDGVIGKITLPSFYESSSSSSCEKDIREAIRNLKKEKKLLGLVVDMRNNSGGFLSQAVKVSSLFVTNGIIIVSKYSRGETKYLRDIDGRLYYSGPLLVLTSKASASAAEIVAQALQDYGTGLIVGDERTYGKGTIQYQTVTDENAKAFYKVTIGRYYTVSGKSTQLEGVKADILIPTQYAAYNIGERFLEYPLRNDFVPSVYLDPATIQEGQRPTSWFERYCLPALVRKNTLWRSMLPILAKNTQMRLASDPNFKAFLAGQGSSDGGAENLGWGQEDLQIEQAVKILQDMIYLQNMKPS